MNLKYVLFSFDGRIRRSDYWIKGLLSGLVSLVVLFLLGGISTLGGVLDIFAGLEFWSSPP